MPQMSKLPFMIVSSVLLMFFVVWIMNVWFKTSKNFESSKGYKKGSNNWPL